jgi:putative transposase
MLKHIARGRSYRRNLPHIQTPGAWYHVVLSLRLGRRLDSDGLSIVLEACRFYEDKRWKLAAVAAMPTAGTHVLCQPLPDPAAQGYYYALETILHSVKGYSAWRINQQTGDRNSLWERESFDREIRNRADFWRVAYYIADNPVKEGLASRPSDYPWLYVHESFSAALSERDFEDER